MDDKTKNKNQPIEIDNLDKKLLDLFDGLVMKKGLIKKLNLPYIDDFIVEYLLATKYSISPETSKGEIEEKLTDVKRIFKKSYFRSKESEKVKSLIKFASEEGNIGNSYNVFYIEEYREDSNESRSKSRSKTPQNAIIDKLRVYLDEDNNQFLGETVITGIKNIKIDKDLVYDHKDLLVEGLWGALYIGYKYQEEENDKKKKSKKKNHPFFINNLKPLQISDFYREKNHLEKNFNRLIDNNKETWINIMLRSIGIEAIKTDMRYRNKMIILSRLIPLVEDNFNLIELGGQNTGKSYLHNYLSTYSHLLSGSETTRAQLFYNNATRKIGIVGDWDVIAFDEVVGSDFDKSLIQFMKTYMESGKFTSKSESHFATASFVFNGNVNNTINALLNTSHLCKPLPEEMHDTAFLNRIHCYLPGWEITPNDNTNIFTNNFAFVTDFFFKFLHSLREDSYTYAISEYNFELSDSISGRDMKAIKKTISGLIKLIHPFGEYTKGDVEEYLEFAMEMRLRVKKQQKELSNTDDFDKVDFSYNNKATITLPEEQEYRQKSEPHIDIKDTNIDIIESYKMKQLNIGLYNKLRAIRDHSSFIINPPDDNFELKLQSRQIYTSVNNSQKKTENLENIMNKIANQVNIDTNDSILERYIKTYSFIENDLDTFIDEINMRKNRRIRRKFNKNIEKRITNYHLNKLDIVFNKLDPSKHRIHFYKDRRESYVYCIYGGFLVSLIRKGRTSKLSYEWEL